MAKSSAVPTVARRGPRILSDVDCQFRWLIYLYLLLLVFEGALRKWFLPGLSDACLLHRERRAAPGFTRWPSSTGASDQTVRM